MNFDYFVVGRHVVLHTRPIPPWPPPSPYRLDFGVLDSDRREIAVARAEPRDGRVEVVLDLVEVDANDDGVADAVRLLCGVSAKLVAADVLVTNGPRDGRAANALRRQGLESPAPGAWLRRMPTEPPPRSAGGSMQALYRDPYRVTWNFEPRPWSLLGPFIQELRARRPGARVLDLGCGYGKNAVLLEELGFEVHGVDVAPAAVERCRRWVRHPERFHVASVDRLPAPDAGFDAVLDVGCLHLVDEAVRARGVAELARVLVPGGLLYTRFFKPRSADWLAVQRFRAESVGLSPTDLVALLAPHFAVNLLDDGEMTLARGVRR